MPYVNPPVCFLCRKVHPCDTQDTLQMVAPDGDTVNVCKDHPGVQEEHDRQKNLTGEESQALAMKALQHPRMRSHLERTWAEINRREEEYLERMTKEGRRHEAIKVLYGA